MKAFLCLSLLLLALLFFEGRAAAQTLPPPAPLLSAKVCGKGVYLLSFGEQSLGRESFEIRCKAGGGYEAVGTSSMKLPDTKIVQDTTIELDQQGVPLRFTIKGIEGVPPIDQTTVFKDGKAMVTSGGETREVPYNRSAIIVNGVTYLLQFIAARYDTARGGEQNIPLFPNLAAQMERTGRDEVSATGPAASARPTVFDRYSLKIAGVVNFVLWADAEGKLAVVAVPAQKFMAVREEYASFVEPLKKIMAAKVKGAAPDYSAPANAPFTAEEVQVQAKGFRLAGTLLLPKVGRAPFPAVVMSTGSGQQERDSNLAGLEGYRPFRQIAERLASHGIAVLRADDRGVGSSGGLETLNNATTFDFADDVRAQIAYLRSRKDIDPERIAIIGHSEGGLIAPLVAASDPRLAAIVLMAGTARRGEDVLRFQLNYQAERNPNLSEEQRASARAETESFIRAIKENGDVSKFPLPLQALSSPWGRAFLDYDPLTAIRKVRQPILILQGELDQQVTMDQARMLEESARKSGNKEVTVRVFPRLNHLFLPAKSGAEREYANLETYALSEDLLAALVDWLAVKLKVKK